MPTVKLGDVYSVDYDSTTHNRNLQAAVEGMLSLSQGMRGGKHHSKPITRKTNRKRKVRKTNRKRKVRKTNRRKVRRKKNTKRMTRRKKSIRNGGNPICGSQPCGSRSGRGRRREPTPSSTPTIVATPDTPPIVAIPVTETLPVVQGDDLDTYLALRNAGQRLSQEDIKPNLLLKSARKYHKALNKLKAKRTSGSVTQNEKDDIISNIVDSSDDITFYELKDYIDGRSRFT